MSEFEQRIGIVDLVEFYGEVAVFDLQRLGKEFKDYFGEKGRGKSLSKEHQNVVKDYARHLTFNWSRPKAVIRAQSVRNPSLEHDVEELMENLGIKPWEQIMENLHNLHLNGRQEAGLDRRACFLAGKATSKLPLKK
jgi:hypothetical protein